MESTSWLSSPVDSRLQPLFPVSLICEHKHEAPRTDSDEQSEAEREKHSRPKAEYEDEVQTDWWSALFD